MLRVRAGRGILASTSSLLTPCSSGHRLRLSSLRKTGSSRPSCSALRSQRLYSTSTPTTPTTGLAKETENQDEDEDEEVYVEAEPDDFEAGDEVIQIMETEPDFMVMSAFVPREVMDPVDTSSPHGHSGLVSAFALGGGRRVENEWDENGDNGSEDPEIDGYPLGPLLIDEAYIREEFDASVAFWGDGVEFQGLESLDLHDTSLRQREAAAETEPQALEEGNRYTPQTDYPIFDTLTTLLTELSQSDNVRIGRRFRGRDTVALRELLARLEEPPPEVLSLEEFDEEDPEFEQKNAIVKDAQEKQKETLYYMWHLKNLYTRNGARIATDVGELDADAPAYIPDPDYRPTRSLSTDPNLEDSDDAVEYVEEYPPQPYPDLMTPDPLMDSRDEMVFPPDKSKGEKYGGKVVIRNHYPMLYESMKLDGAGPFEEDDLHPEQESTWKPTTTDLTDNSLTLPELASLPSNFSLESLYIFPLLTRRVVSQTSKGRQFAIQVFTVIGDGNGMVGLGMGKDEQAQRAYDKAMITALRGLDYVQRFEDRTIPYEIQRKFHATTLILRPRPPGFGLRCSPIIHQILKAAGIKDISAKIWGSRNKIVVMQSLMRILHAGAGEPLGMGDGIGGRGKKKAKGGWGIRMKEDVERERGRRLVDLMV